MFSVYTKRRLQQSYVSHYMSWTNCWRYLVLGYLPQPWSVSVCEPEEVHQLLHIACDVCQHGTHGALYDVLQPLQNRKKIADGGLIYR
jgi:hypothetical protein